MAGRFFGDNSIRLMRDDWERIGLQAFAEELYAMANDSSPTTTDVPLRLTQSDPNTPAVTINNNTGDTNTPTVRVITNDPNGGPPNVSNCPCPPDGSGGTTSGGGGQPQPPKDDGTPPGPQDVNTVPLTGGPMRIFNASLQIEIHGGAFDGQRPSFASDNECKPYNPPLNNKPQSFFQFQTGVVKLIVFLTTKAAPYGTYTVLRDEVSDPGPPCGAP